MSFKWYQIVMAAIAIMAIVTYLPIDGSWKGVVYFFGLLAVAGIVQDALEPKAKRKALGITCYISGAIGIAWAAWLFTKGLGVAGISGRLEASQVSDINSGVAMVLGALLLAFLSLATIVYTYDMKRSRHTDSDGQNS